MKIAIYVRVSTPHQTQLQTIEQQLSRLQIYCQEQGWQWPTEHLYRDDGYSGAKLNRPGLDRLRDAARQASFERILITAPDRLARNYVHQMLLIEELETTGCQIVFVERPMSTDPHDQLLLQIRGAVAEYERTLIAERLRRGRLAKYRAGTLLPWSRAPYGYREDPDRPRDPLGVRLEPVEAASVVEIYQRYLTDGTTFWSLIKYLEQIGVPAPRGKAYWNKSSLRQLLTNPVYTGNVYAGRLKHEPARRRHSALLPINPNVTTAYPTDPAQWLLVAQVPALVTKEQFEQVQLKMAKNKATAKRNNKTNAYLLRALVSCGICKLSCTGRANGPHHYYACGGKQPPMTTGLEARCPSRLIPTTQLDELVWQDLCEIIQQPALISEALQRAQGGAWLPQELQARRENLRKASGGLTQQLERLTEAYLAGVVKLEEYKRRRQDIESRLQTLVEQTRQLEASTHQQLELSGLVETIEEFCQRVEQGLAQASFEQKRQLIELLVDRVVVSGEEVEIRYVVPTSSASERTKFCHLRSDYTIGIARDIDIAATVQS